MRRTGNRTKLAYMNALCKSVPNQMLRPGDVKFLYDDELRHCRVYSMRMPITDTWQSFEVSDQLFNARCVSETASTLHDYRADALNVLAVARDHQPMNDELRPICPEECQKFGVRVGVENPCFIYSKPRKRFTLDIP